MGVYLPTPTRGIGTAHSDPPFFLGASLATLYDMTIDKVADALRVCAGNLTATAKALNLRRRALVDYVYKHEELSDLLKELREELLDQAETNIYNLVASGDDKATRFVLGTLGKDRGYTSRSEVDAKHSFTGEEAVNKLLEARKRAAADGATSDAGPSSSAPGEGSRASGASLPLFDAAGTMIGDISVKDGISDPSLLEATSHRLSHDPDDD